MSKQEREALIKALETIPKETIAEATAQVLDAVRRDRDRANTRPYTKPIPK